MQVSIFSSKKLFLVSGILFFISQVAILVILFSAAPAMEIFRQQTTFSADEFQAIFANWGALKTATKPPPLHPARGPPKVQHHFEEDFAQQHFEMNFDNFNQSAD